MPVLGLAFHKGGMMGDILIDGLETTGAPFRLGAVLSKTFSVLGRQFGKFVLLTLIPMVPVLLFTLFTQPGRVASPGSLATASALLGILTFVLQIIAQATTLYGAFQEMRGEPFTVGQSLTVGFRRALPLLGVAITASLAIGLAAVLFLVPGIIVACMLYVAVPACVIEKLGVAASISRSAVLTRGYRWPIFGLFLLVGVVSLIVGLIMLRLGSGDALLGKLLYFAWQVISTSFGAVLASVVYHDLRVAKEGIDIDYLANVFD
jgi:hypothetical protein